MSHKTSLVIMQQKKKGRGKGLKPYQMQNQEIAASENLFLNLENS